MMHGCMLHASQNNAFCEMVIAARSKEEGGNKLRKPIR